MLQTKMINLAGCWIPGFEGTDSTPALSRDGQAVCIGSYSGEAFGICARTGKPLWNATLDPPVGYSAVGEGTPALIRNVSDPLGHFGDCFVIATLESVRCLDVNTGSVYWSWSPSEGGQLSSCGAVDSIRGVFFVGTLKRSLFAVNTTDGTTVWHYPAHGEIWATHGPRLVGPDLVCTGR